MMNEYLCRNFVADQILTEIVPQPLRGRDIDSQKSTVESQSANHVVKEKMLSDEGSLGYKNWLNRMTTLEDIYRHYDEPPLHDDSLTVKNISRGSESDEEEYERGQVTGYAIPQYVNHMPNTKQEVVAVNQQDYRANQKIFKYGGGDVHEIYEYPASAGNDYGYGGTHQIHHFIETHGGHDDSNAEDHSDEQEDHGSYKKDLALHEIFDIALTTLAFLSFGCFMLQVVMCITSDANVQMTMLPMGMGVDPGVAPTAPEFRTRRDITRNSTDDINELGRRILQSFDAVLVASQDEGACLRRIICDNNRYSRTRTDRQKYWLPIWGLGLSWLSGHLHVKSSPATSILSSLRASILGLGGADCSSTLLHCDLKYLKTKKHKI
ncbi:uncharacterized protein LOC113383696 [Ctenocephalides felis]|uniref:uncharacterized protein LOC113383696 n=1 Tax=Ctenocephalides felis TaxID=7515 RepID=UPI000E6E4783|nr:uncharacterized protein LOC113383696 [Ctenocephalides felis]